jgi:hypothetical protein
LTGHRRLDPAAVTGRPSPSGPHANTCGVALGGMKLGLNRGQHAHIALEIQASNPFELKAQGRWDRKRVGNLRCWSTRRAVQDRPRLSKSPVNPRLFASHRPAASKDVQPLCSQFCSQRPRQSSLLWRCELALGKNNRPAMHDCTAGAVSPGGGEAPFSSRSVLAGSPSPVHVGELLTTWCVGNDTQASGAVCVSDAARVGSVRREPV